MFYVYRYKIEGAIKRDKGDERAPDTSFISTRMQERIITVKNLYTSSGECNRIGQVLHLR